MDRAIDWPQTRAFTRRERQGTEVYVNLAGREPHGIVSAADFERVQEAVIDVLLEWRDPGTGKRAAA
jgi:predicted AlkP superfamily phosphohydrolase/phosphomutase